MSVLKGPQYFPLQLFFDMNTFIFELSPSIPELFNKLSDFEFLKHNERHSIDPDYELSHLHLHGL